MNTYITEIEYQGEKCLEMSAGGYLSLFAYEIGGLMIRLKDEKNNIEILRFDENTPIETIKASPVVYGWPILYLPNRLANGVLKTSEKSYQLPINEPLFNNFIHGFLHLRKYKIKSTHVSDSCVNVIANYIYDENDEMFQFFPVSFEAEISYTLSADGLEQDFKITNLSDAVLPVGVGSHTAIKCPFSQDSSENDLRLTIFGDEKIAINEKFLCTGEFNEPDAEDLRFLNGEVNPLTESIDNQMFRGADSELNGEQFYGAFLTDIKTGTSIGYETGAEYKFWLVWNEWGNKGYCCPEPMSWLINAPNIALDNEISGYTEIRKDESWSGYQRLFTFKQ